MRLIISIILLGLLIVETAYSFGSTPPPSNMQVTHSLPQGVFFGVFREGAPRNMELITYFQNKYQSPLTMIMWYQDYSSPFPTTQAQQVWDSGAVPQIVWEPWFWGEEDKINLNDILAGKWDSYLKTWAEEAKNFGKPVLVRWAHEFNIPDYPWSVGKNGKNPQIYINAWQHVHDIFRKAGAKNVKWIWCPMRESWPQEIWNEWTLAYPGDEYVDWIGLDGYNWGTTQNWSKWQTFSELFRTPARIAWRKYPNKPIMIAEFACAEKGGDKASWIRSIPKELLQLPYLNALLWFDLRKEASWQVSSSTESAQAFKELMANPILLSSREAFLNLNLGYSKDTPKQLASAQKTSLPIKIDGNLNDWGGSSFIFIDKENQVQEGISKWFGPKDLSAKAAFRWDADNFYLGIEVTDNFPLKNSRTKAEIWNGDNIEFTLETKSGNDPNRCSFEMGDYQVGLSTGNGKDVKPMAWIWTKYREAKNYEIAVKRTGSGYSLEARIPWNNFGKFSPRANEKILFDLAIDDADGAERKVQLVWNGDFMFYKDPGVWGYLRFIE